MPVWLVIFQTWINSRFCYGCVSFPELHKYLTNNNKTFIQENGSQAEEKVKCKWKTWEQ